MYQTDKSPANPPVALQRAGSAADEDAELVAFEWFAMAHPHEAYETYPEHFWLFFQTKCPGKTRAEMEKILADTAEPPNADLRQDADSERGT